MPMKRLLSGYMTMVGVPLVVVAFVLHAGRNMVAPPSIDGDWIMQWESPDAAGKCQEQLPDEIGGSLAISQSGRHLTAHWNQDRTSPLKGILDDGRFILCSLGSSREPCSHDPLHLNGRILEQKGARRLELRLDSLPDDCQDLVLLSSWRKIDLTARAPKGYNY